MRGMSLVRLGRVANPAPAALTLLCEGAVHLGLLLSTGRIGLDLGVGGEIEDGGVQTSGVTVAEI